MTDTATTVPTSVAIARALEPYLESGQVPRGRMAEIAVEVGVTRSYVQLIARNLGLRSEPIPTTVCTQCGGPRSTSNQSGLCRDCLNASAWSEAPCNNCGKPVPYRPAQLSSRMRTGRYSGRVFCSRACVSAFRRGRTLKES